MAWKDKLRLTPQQRRHGMNVVANLSRGGAASLVALLLPPFLIRQMPQLDFGIWALVLQISAYAGYLDFGLQSAIGRNVAFSNAKNDEKERDEIFNTALVGLIGACLLFLVALVGALSLLPSLFPSIPGDKLGPMRWALLLVGVSTALGLPASAWNGVFIGLQRNEIPALTIGLSRIATALAVAYAAWNGASIVTMALLMALCNLGGYAAQVIALRVYCPSLRIHLGHATRAAGRKLADYSIGMTTMSFAMLLVNGVDLMIVGRFDFGALTLYTASAGIIVFLAGVLFAIINVMMPHAAAMRARNEVHKLGLLVVRSTRLSVLLLILVSCPLIIYSGEILKLWTGASVSPEQAWLLIVLLIGNVLRLMGGPYATILVGASKPRLVSTSALAEGLTNFVFSVILGFAYGAMGVAIGTLIGAAVSLLAHLFYSIPRTQSDIRFQRRDFILSGILAPLVATSPLMVTAALSIVGLAVPIWIVLAAFGLSVLGAYSLVFHSRRSPLPFSDINSTIGESL